MSPRFCVVTAAVAAFVASSHAPAADPAPQSKDSRLSFELFAEQPQVVTPTGLAVDSRGRVFVAESHTHFRPDGYDGPTSDRILILEDTDGDGRADQRRVFHEGFTHVMDIAFHPDGSLYVATRMDISRLRDADNDGQADQVDRIVSMETAGNYPHNGLSGLAFDVALRLRFGLGENLGATYTLRGTDDATFSGGGEGGSTYEVNADGTGLERTSTGWWNPFGICVDAFGRVFGTDNDPGASPPCRLIQVIDGADYGYEYRYGRTGLHPLVTWTGSLPGTLPMVGGTGEAPCSVLAYEAIGLPAEYRGDLFVASWADHRLERFTLTEDSKQGLVQTRREILVQAPGEFRPVDLATAPDGTVYVSDWVSSSYKLHKTGRVWRLGPSSDRAPSARTPKSAQEAIASPDRSIREQAARTLMASSDGKSLLREHMIRHADSRVRATALAVLAAADDRAADFEQVANRANPIALRVPALRALLQREGAESRRWANGSQPAALRAEAVRRLDPAKDHQLVARAVVDGGALLFHAAVEALASHWPAGSQHFLTGAPRLQLAALLGAKRSAQRGVFARKSLGEFLQAQDSELLFAAVKWIADDVLVGYRDVLVGLLGDERLDYPLFLAVTAAVDRLDGKPPLDQPAADALIARITDEAVPVGVRRAALRALDPTADALTDDALLKLTNATDRELRLEAVRTLSLRRSEVATAALIRIASDGKLASEIRAVAVAGLGRVTAKHSALLVQLAVEDGTSSVRDEALRGLVGSDLLPVERRLLEGAAAANPAVKEGVARVLTRLPGPRPEPTDHAGWAKLLDGPADSAAGERVFFSSRVGTCSTCHQVEGRGAAVGPDLSEMDRRLKAYGAGGTGWLLETILEPSRAMAPQYTPWFIVTKDGQQHVGLPRRKGGSNETYLGLDGKEFILTKDNIAIRSEATESIMPRGLLSMLTTQELRDLFAFLKRDRP